jgi:hypothetical protein
MGSSAEISIGKYEYISFSSNLLPLLLIFNTWDRRTENFIEEEVEYTTYKYVTTVKLAKQCLDISGYKVTRAKQLFKSIKADIDFSFELEYGEKKVEALKKFTFENWFSSVKYFAQKLSSEGYPWYDEDKAWFKRIDKKNVSDYMVAKSLSYNSLLHWGLPEENIDEWIIFRIVLEAFDDDEPIILDYTALVDGGYCDAIQEENDFITEKIIILTEGSTDSEFISRSIKILYPHLNKFFYFIDFGVMKISGGVGFLSHYIKAFAGAKINNNIIGLFDNDSAALDELRNLRGIYLPDNIRVMNFTRNFDCTELSYAWTNTRPKY